MKNCKIWNPQLVIPETFEQCFTYEKQVLWLYAQLQKMSDRIEELEAEVEFLKKS